MFINVLVAPYPKFEGWMKCGIQDARNEKVLTRLYALWKTRHRGSEHICRYSNKTKSKFHIDKLNLYTSSRVFINYAQ